MKRKYELTALDEVASTVFNKNEDGQYVVEKTRTGDVVRGAAYSKGFVIAYAYKNNDVYVKGGI